MLDLFVPRTTGECTQEENVVMKMAYLYRLYIYILIKLTLSVDAL